MKYEYFSSAKREFKSNKILLAFLMVTFVSSISGLCIGFEISIDGLPEKPGTGAFDELLPVKNKPARMVIGNGFVVAVKADGSVWSWGTGLYGELGRGARELRNYEPKKIPGLEGVVEVASGFRHIIALKKDGTVWGWGDNGSGQIGSEKAKRVNFPERISIGSRISKVAATAEGSVFLSNEGRLFILGGNKDKVFPYPDEVIRKPLEIAKIDDVQSLSASPSSICVISKSRKLYVFGENYLNTEDIDVSGVKVSDAFVSYFAVLLDAEGFMHVGAKAGAEIYGDTKEIIHGGLRKVSGVGRIVNFSYTGGAAKALDEKGRLWQWGTSVGSFPDPGGAGVSRVSAPTVFFKIEGIEDIFSGPLVSAIFTKDGSVYFWGSGQGGVRTREFKERYPSKQEWMTPEKIKWTWK